jgi:hypothetical protein
MNEEQRKELENQSKQLKTLSELNEFNLWKNSYALPELEKIKIAKKKIMGMPEAEVKAMILYETFIEDLFINMFKEL